MDELARTPLRALLALSQRGTMTCVARELGYTPGAVSQQIAKLEAVIGAPLVIRAGRGVRLTDAGRVLAKHADYILRAEDAALAAARATQAIVGGQITIGVFGSTAGALLAPFVLALADQHPGIEVRSREIAVDETASAVRRGEVDLAFGLDYSTAPLPRDPAVDFIPLLSERFGLAVPKRLSTRRRIRLVDAAPWPWILTPARTYFGQAIRTACRAVGFEPTVIHEVTDTAAAIALAQAGLGVTPITPLMRQLPRSNSRPTELEEDITRHIVLIRHRSDRDRPTTRAATTVLQAVVSAIRETDT